MTPCWPSPSGRRHRQWPGSGSHHQAPRGSAGDGPATMAARHGFPGDRWCDRPGTCTTHGVSSITGPSVESPPDSRPSRVQRPSSTCRRRSGEAQSQHRALTSGVGCTSTCAHTLESPPPLAPHPAPARQWMGPARQSPMTMARKAEHQQPTRRREPFLACCTAGKGTGERSHSWPDGVWPGAGRWAGQ